MRITKLYQGSTLIEGNLDNPESIGCTDDQSRIYDVTLDTELSKLEIKSLSEVNSFWNILSTLIKDNMNLVLRKSNLLEMTYDADQANDIMIDYLSIIYGIQFPPYYTSEQRRLLLKYFPNFIKFKGIPQYALNIINLIDRTESELYLSSPDRYEVTPVSNGLYSIELPKRIISIDFTFDILNRLTPEGMYYMKTPDQEVNYTVYLNDSINVLDTQNPNFITNPTTYDSNSAAYDKSSVEESGLIYDISSPKK